MPTFDQIKSWVTEHANELPESSKKIFDDFTKDAAAANKNFAEWLTANKAKYADPAVDEATKFYKEKVEPAVTSAVGPDAWEKAKNFFSTTSGSIGAIGGLVAGYMAGDALGKAIGGDGIFGSILGFILGLVGAVVGLAIGSGIGGAIGAMINPKATYEKDLDNFRETALAQFNDQTYGINNTPYLTTRMYGKDGIGGVGLVYIDNQKKTHTFMGKIEGTAEQEILTLTHLRKQVSGGASEELKLENDIKINVKRNSQGILDLNDLKSKMEPALKAADAAAAKLPLNEKLVDDSGNKMKTLAADFKAGKYSDMPIEGTNANIGSAKKLTTGLTPTV